MVPVKTCRTPILDEVLQWIMLVDNVVKWGAVKYLEGVVERLGMVARRGLLQDFWSVVFRRLLDYPRSRYLIILCSATCRL